MKRFLLPVVTGFVMLCLYWFSPYHRTENQSVVTFVYPQISAIQDTVTLHGSVTDPYRERLYADGYSRIVNVYAEEGDFVQEGQLLMTLERLDTPQTEQAAAASAMVELQKTLENGDIADAETLIQQLLSHNAFVEETTVEEKVYNLYSPCDGIVMSVQGANGREASYLFPCIEISNPEYLQIEVTAGEDVVSQLKPDMKCSIAVPAFGLQNVSGKVLKIAPYAQKSVTLSGNTTVETQVSILPESSREVLRSGYRASAKIYLARRESVVLLPYEAVMQDASGMEYVYKLQGSRIERQPVICGSELETQVEICDGITAGDLVVVNPQADWEGEVVHFAVS